MRAISAVPELLVILPVQINILYLFCLYIYHVG